MEHLSSGDYKNALVLLKQAESKMGSILLTPRNKFEKDQMAALTFNNLGCYYKKASKPNVALKYMKAALKLEKDLHHLPSHICSTQLNICATLSLQGKHREAQSYANAAITDLMLALKVLKINMVADAQQKLAIMQKQKITTSMIDRVSNENLQMMHQTLSLAYYNLAAELEHTQDHTEAI